MTLNKHEGTDGLLNADLLYLAQGEPILGGTAGAKRFIEGLAGPAAGPSGVR